MVYAIVQKELIVPEVEQLKRAFTVSPLLTGYDAQAAWNDAYGILLRGQELAQAQMLQEALRRETVETELVDEAHLPVLPTARVAQQVAYGPEHLTVQDPMQRSWPIPWNELMLIAAGYVKVREIRKPHSGSDETTTHAAGIGQDLRSGPGGREEERLHFLVDLFLIGGARYRIDAEEFSFDHLGSEQTDDMAMNFVTLVRDLARYAPNAGQNRGAYHACLEPPELFPYPTKAAFIEETIWMLWRIGRMLSPVNAQL